VRFLTAAVALRPDSPGALSNLGNVLRDKGQLDEAIALHRKAIELNPKLAQAHTDLGNVLERKGRVDDAIACYRKAIELDPTFAPAHTNRPPHIGAIRPSAFGPGRLEHDQDVARTVLRRRLGGPPIAGAGQANLEEVFLEYENAFEDFAFIISSSGRHVDVVRFLGRVDLVCALLHVAAMLLNSELSPGDVDLVALHVLCVPVHRRRDDDPTPLEPGCLLSFLPPDGARVRIAGLHAECIRDCKRDAHQSNLHPERLHLRPPLQP
jgi:tetratricopeptide (TPR) repeat protein